VQVRADCGGCRDSPLCAQAGGRMGPGLRRDL